MAVLADRFSQAFLYAFELHKEQFRKGTRSPYIGHLLAVTAIVIEYGGDEDQAIAALLHDAVEDQGGYDTLEEIRRRFGERVASIVDGCTDAYETPKPPWLERKAYYLDHLIEHSEEVWFVSLADKLHNARTILADLRQIGSEVWGRFNGGKEGTLWYHRSLAEFFIQHYPSAMADEYHRVVDEIQGYG